MTPNDIYPARQEAHRPISEADRTVRDLIGLAKHRLRASECWADDLRAPKAELQDFNAVTGKWKDKK